MLKAAYFMLRDDVDYKDLGPEYFNNFDRNHAASRLVKRLTSLGFTVQLTDAA